MNLIKSCSFEQLALTATFLLLAFKTSDFTAAAFIFTCVIYACARFVDARKVDHSDDVKAQVKALKEKLDLLTLQRGVGR